jgi:hypothetical protein
LVSICDKSLIFIGSTTGVGLFIVLGDTLSTLLVLLTFFALGELTFNPLITLLNLSSCFFFAIFLMFFIVVGDIRVKGLDETPRALIVPSNLCSFLFNSSLENIESRNEQTIGETALARNPLGNFLNIIFVLLLPKPCVLFLFLSSNAFVVPLKELNFALATRIILEKSISLECLLGNGLEFELDLSPIILL